MLANADVRQHGLQHHFILQGPHQIGRLACLHHAVHLSPLGNPSSSSKPCLTHPHHLEAKGFRNPCLFAAHRLLDGIDSLLGVAALCVLLLDVLDRLQGVLSCARVRINNTYVFKNL